MVTTVKMFSQTVRTRDEERGGEREKRSKGRGGSVRFL